MLRTNILHRLDLGQTSLHEPAGLDDGVIPADGTVSGWNLKFGGESP